MCETCNYECNDLDYLLFEECIFNYVAKNNFRVSFIDEKYRFIEIRYCGADSAFENFCGVCFINYYQWLNFDDSMFYINNFAPFISGIDIETYVYFRLYKLND